MRLRWRDATGILARDRTLYVHEMGKDIPLRAPAGRYTLEVTDLRGAVATTSFDLRPSEPPLVVELPLPTR
jgi:hypothetical protein